MNRSSVRSVATVAALAVSFVVVGAADALAQRSGRGGGSAGGGSGSARVGTAVPRGASGGGRASSAVPGGPGRPAGTSVAVPRAVTSGGRTVVVGGGYGGYGYRYGYGYGYPYGYYYPWYGCCGGFGWGFSIGFGSGYPYGYYGGYPYAAYYGGYPYYGYPYPYSPNYDARYAAAPAIEVTPESQRSPASGSFGSLSVRVQPGDAEILIDGEPWKSPASSHLVIQLAPGRHRVTVRKASFDTYSEDVLIRADKTLTLNVSLLRGER